MEAIVVMGAKPKALQLRRKRAYKIAEKIEPVHIYWLGDEFPQGDFTFPGSNTWESIKNFVEIVPCKPEKVYIVTAVYHIPRCKLILKNLGVENVQSVISDWRLWQTPIKVLIGEYKKYKQVKGLLPKYRKLTDFFRKGI